MVWSLKLWIEDTHCSLCTGLGAYSALLRIKDTLCTLQWHWGSLSVWSLMYWGILIAQSSSDGSCPHTSTKCSQVSISKNWVKLAPGGRKRYFWTFTTKGMYIIFQIKVFVIYIWQTHQLTDQSINWPINWQTNQLTDRLTDRLTNRPSNQQSFDHLGSLTDKNSPSILHLQCLVGHEIGCITAVQWLFRY